MRLSLRRYRAILIGSPGGLHARRRCILLALLGAGACGVDYGLEGKEFGNQGAGDPDPDPPLDTGYLSPFGCRSRPWRARWHPTSHTNTRRTRALSTPWSNGPCVSSIPGVTTVVMAPAVGQLTDDNWMVIDRWDAPDIVIITDDEGEYTHKKACANHPGRRQQHRAALLRADVDDETTAYGSTPIDTPTSRWAISTATASRDRRHRTGLRGPQRRAGRGRRLRRGRHGHGNRRWYRHGSGPGPGTGSGTGSGDTYVSFDSDETGLPGGPTDTASSGPGSGTGGSTGTGTGAGTGGAGAGGGASGEGTSSGGGEGDIPVRPIVPDPRLPDGRSACQVVAFAVSGDVKWIAHDLELPCGGHAPALGDLEGDGVVEVVVGDAVMDGRNGSILWEGGAGKGAYPTHPEVGYHTVIADLEAMGSGSHHGPDARCDGHRPVRLRHGGGGRLCGRRGPRPGRRR